jgi:hypothetical protein
LLRKPKKATTKLQHCKIHECTIFFPSRRRFRHKPTHPFNKAFIADFRTEFYFKGAKPPSNAESSNKTKGEKKLPTQLLAFWPRPAE